MLLHIQQRTIDFCWCKKSNNHKVFDENKAEMQQQAESISVEL